MERFVVEIRFDAETDMTTVQIERKIIALLKHKMDWAEKDSIDLEVMEREDNFRIVK